MNRRRLFCKYVLPYIMYLEEVAMVLYAGSRGEDRDSDSSGSFSSAPMAGLLHQMSSHPSLRLTQNPTKSFGPWRGTAQGGGGPRRSIHGDKSSVMHLRPETSRLAG